VDTRGRQSPFALYGERGRGQEILPVLNQQRPRERAAHANHRRARTLVRARIVFPLEMIAFFRAATNDVRIFSPQFFLKIPAYHDKWIMQVRDIQEERRTNETIPLPARRYLRKPQH